MKASRVTIELDEKSQEILDRLRDGMPPSAFFRMMLKMVDSGAVSAPPPTAPAPRKKRKPPKR